MTDTTSELTAAADGRQTKSGIPHGFTSLTPFLAITPAKEAIIFYQDVFGARTISVTEIGGIVVHAELDFGQGRLQIGAPNPDYHLVPAPNGDDDCYSVGFYCADADAVVARAERSGATVREPLSTFVSGDRTVASGTPTVCAGPS